MPSPEARTQQPRPASASASSTHTWTSAPRLRYLFLALVSLSVLSVLVVSSRMGVAPRLRALQSPHKLLVAAMKRPMETATVEIDPSSDKQSDFSIPRIIHQSWKNIYRIPTRFHPWMKSWVDFHPTWTYVFWTDQDNLRLFEQLYPQYLHVAKAVKKVSLADMARYALLHQVGGLYVDADFECLQPFDDLHRENELFLSSEPLVHTVLLEKSNSAALCNALMASAPGHPFWLRVLDNIKEKFDRERLNSDAVELTGPRMVKQTYLSPNGAFNSEESDIIVFPSEYFYPEVAYWNVEPMQEACSQRHDDAAQKGLWLAPEVPQGRVYEQNPRDAPLAMHVVSRRPSGRVQPPQRRLYVASHAAKHHLHRHHLRSLDMSVKSTSTSLTLYTSHII